MKCCAPCQLKHKLTSKDHKWFNDRCDICKEECNVTEVETENENRIN